MILILTIVVSLIAGISSGLLGIGGGVLLVPFFHYVLKMNLHLAIGTSLVLIVPTALIGALRHSGQGFVDWRVAAFALIFTVLGGFIGAGLSLQMDVSLLKKIFAVFLILIAVKMFFQ